MKIHIHQSDDKKMFSIIIENQEPLTIEDLPIIFEKVCKDAEENIEKEPVCGAV